MDNIRANHFFQHKIPARVFVVCFPFLKNVFFCLPSSWRFRTKQKSNKNHLTGRCIFFSLLECADVTDGGVRWKSCNQIACATRRRKKEKKRERKLSLVSSTHQTPGAIQEGRRRKKTNITKCIMFVLFFWRKIKIFVEEITSTTKPPERFNSLPVSVL